MTKKTKNLVYKSISNTYNYINYKLKNCNEDERYILLSFKTKLDEIGNKIGFDSNVTAEDINKMIFEFDTIMFNWMKNLTYKLPNENEHQNDLYDVLFCSLKAIVDIIEEYDYEEDEREIENEWIL